MALAAHQPYQAQQQPQQQGSAALSANPHFAAPGEGERKVATILFADIVGSTEMVANLDPEDARHMLASVLDIMQAAVQRYDGTVVGDIGDGIKAAFGAPAALEDHALRACYAALDMQAAIRSRSAQHQRVRGMALQLRIGIHTGLVVYNTHPGSSQPHALRLDGIPVNIAARLEPLAPPGGILLSRDTLALAQGFIRVREMGPRKLRGIEPAVEVYQRDGLVTHLRIQAHAARGLSRFVGRGYEFDALHAAGRQAHGGTGRVVALAGDAGVGKSRLFLEFVRSSAMAGWRVMEAGAPSYGKTTAYLPLIDLMQRYFEIEPDDSDALAFDKLMRKLAAFGDERLSARAPYLLGVLGRGLDNAAWQGATPAERQNALFYVLRRLLRYESQQQPLCLMFEDLHWVDEGTLAFLDLLVDSLPAYRMLLLVNYRPDYEDRWAQKAMSSRIDIAPLADTGAEALLEALMGSAPELHAIKRTLNQATAGNPLYIEESVRALIDNGVLAGELGHLQMAGVLPAGFVPPTIQALLAARIDRLPSATKKVLECAAVIGGNISLGLLEAVAPLDRGQVTHSLQALRQAGLLYEMALYPEIAYTFKHAMTREVAYGTMLREYRMALHARTALALASLAGGHIEEYIEPVATHAEQGGLWRMALDYLDRAGTKAFGLYANAQAVAYFERAIGVLQQVPEDRATLASAVDLRFKLRNALIPLCELERVGRSLDEVEPLLVRLGDSRRRAQWAAFQCNDHFLAARQSQAIQVGEAGLQLARECGDRAIEEELLYRIGQSYHLLGDNLRAVGYFGKCIDFDKQPARNHLQLSIIVPVTKRIWFAVVLAECGDFREGLAHAKQALATAENQRHPLSQVLGWFAIGYLLLRKGELDGAIGALERGMKLCDEYALPIWRSRLLSCVGLAYAYCGRFDEGVELTTQAVADAGKNGLVVDLPMFLVHAGEVALLATRRAEAVQHGERALALAVQHAAKVPEAWARRLIVCAARTGAPQRQSTDITELETAMNLALACGARPLAALCQASLEIGRASCRERVLASV